MRRYTRLGLLGIIAFAAVLVIGAGVIIAIVLLREPNFDPPDTALRTLRGQYQAVVGELAFVSSLTSDGEGRIYISEFRTGRIRILERNDAGEFALSEFARVPLPDGMQAEQGLWTLAVHPAGTFLYASAVATTGDEDTARIVRFPIMDDGSAGPLEVICDGLPSERIHNGGALAFGLDGMLYATVGDTVRSAQVRNVVELLADSGTLEDYSDLAGAIYRIDPEGCREPPLPIESLLFAGGFRNPYGMAFSPEGTLYVTDNGPSCCDRVYRVEPGGDHGWPRYGVDQDEFDEFKEDPSVVAPLTHSGEHRIAATQLVFFDGDAYGGVLRNSLVYGTYTSESLIRVELSPDGRAAVFEEVLLTLPNRGHDDVPENIVGVTVDSDGFIYFSTLDTVFRLTGVTPLGPEPGTQR